MSRGPSALHTSVLILGTRTTAAFQPISTDSQKRSYGWRCAPLIFVPSTVPSIGFTFPGFWLTRTRRDRLDGSHQVNMNEERSRNRLHASWDEQAHKLPEQCVFGPVLVPQQVVASVHLSVDTWYPRMFLYEQHPSMQGVASKRYSLPVS